MRFSKNFQVISFVCERLRNSSVRSQHVSYLHFLFYIHTIHSLDQHQAKSNIQSKEWAIISFLSSSKVISKVCILLSFFMSCPRIFRRSQFVHVVLSCMRLLVLLCLSVCLSVSLCVFLCFIFIRLFVRQFRSFPIIFIKRIHYIHVCYGYKSITLSLKK